MRKTRAEPKHKLDNFTRWSREIMAISKREGGTGSPPQRTINNRKKGGENDAEK